MKESQIKTGYIQITRRCNNNCIICSNPFIDKELSFSSIKEYIEEYKKRGINNIILTGGEPTLHTDINQIIKFLNNKNFNFTLITNGIKISDKKICKEMKESGLKKINISFYSHNEDISKKLNSKNNMSYVLKAIENCIEEGIQITINLVITNLNYNHLKETVLFLEKRFPQIENYSINFVDVIGRAKDHLETVPAYSKAELGMHNLFDYLKKKDKEFRVERVPLCYMNGFEEFSTEAIENINKKGYDITFLKEKGECFGRGINKPASKRKDYVKSEKCKYCDLESFCPGVCKNYAGIFGLNEISPVFGRKRAKEIIRKIKKI